MSSLEPALIRTRDLRAQGISWRAIRDLVDAKLLVRLRQGAFCPPETDADLVRAGELRGQLACVSELRRRSVFVLDHHEPHVHVEPSNSRLPSRPSAYRIHREVLHRRPDPRALAIEGFDAVVEAVQCQTARAALATLDSALHLGVLRLDEVDDLFAALPHRYAVLRPLIDERSESGPETFMRLILRSLGCEFELQVEINGVGRVDFVVDGWLIVECDSRSHHASWDQQRADRRRDQAAATLGFATFRPIAEDIMWRPDIVRAAVVGLLGLR